MQDSQTKAINHLVDNFHNFTQFQHFDHLMAGFSKYIITNKNNLWHCTVYFDYNKHFTMFQ